MALPTGTRHPAFQGSVRHFAQDSEIVPIKRCFQDNPVQSVPRPDNSPGNVPTGQAEIQRLANAVGIGRLNANPTWRNISHLNRDSAFL
jgi:hypothetical protein